MCHDFRPVLEPAVGAIQAVEDTGKLQGLQRALRHLTAEAERIAETYADMGADHAGPLFNRVMGNQASDGAFFTRPVAAAIAARLTLDASGDADGKVNWTDPDVWREHKTVDLACGSGTLLAAMLTDLKRRARAQGASESEIADLQKVAVEETIKGMDINDGIPATGGGAADCQQPGHPLPADGAVQDALRPIPRMTPPRYPRRDLWNCWAKKPLCPRNNEQFQTIADDKIASQPVWDQPDDAELEDAVKRGEGCPCCHYEPALYQSPQYGRKVPLRDPASIAETHRHPGRSAGCC